MSSVPAKRFGEGPLSRVAAWVYTLLIVELLLLATTVPGLVPLILLERDPSNIPLMALCLLPVGPALSAALFALQHRSSDLTDLRPAVEFWRSYRANFVGVLKLWAPLLVWLAIVAVNLANFEAAGVPIWWAGLMVMVAVVATLAGINALVITSLFSFRARDVARLGLYFLVRTKAVALGNASLLVVAAGVIVLSSEAVLALLGSLLTLALLRNARPMITLIQKEFVA
ncbi:MAG TPA: DUF624 domain-containing protein [Candidatus Limnocylindrales bacterium]|nr:DUF624 domain-containing protein [Candidatus Limnocylindrales bacterium]